MRVVCIVLALLLSSPGARAQTAAPGFFAFVLLGEGSDGRPVPMVRSVVEGAMSCPVLRSSVGGVSSAMAPRRRPPGGQFDAVLVCEARYPVGEAASVFMGDRRIDLPNVSLGTPRRVVLIGDSGCRGPALDKPQNCDGDGFAKVWPFGVLSDEEADKRPDLIVHVGDYNYRGTERGLVLPPRLTGYAAPISVNVYDTGDLDDEDVASLPIGAAYWSQNIVGSPNPDKWINWRDDFFRPAAKLLVAAPWLMSRGNHELCSRGGPGWFYLLDAGSPLLGPGHKQVECPPQLPPDWQPGAWPKPPALPFAGLPFPTHTSAPFRLKLGRLNIIAVDSANAADAVLFNLDTYLTQYREVARMLVEDQAPTWLVTHRPIWAVVKRDKGGPIGLTPYGFISETQREAINRVFRDGLPRHVTAVIAGHMHRFQAIGFEGLRPPHLAVGTGGMELSHVQPPPSPDNPKAPIRVEGLDRSPAWVVGLRDFAAMIVRPVEDGAWTGVLYGTGGETLAVCDSRWPGPGSKRSVCELK
jgi:hypothetical protein